MDPQLATSQSLTTTSDVSPHKKRVSVDYSNYDPLADASLLTNYKLVQATTQRAPLEKQPIASEGRNFALQVLERITPKLTRFKNDFEEIMDTKSHEVDGEHFVGLVSAYVRGVAVDKNLFRVASKQNVLELSTRIELNFSDEQKKSFRVWSKERLEGGGSLSTLRDGRPLSVNFMKDESLVDATVVSGSTSLLDVRSPKCPPSTPTEEDDGFLQIIKHEKTLRDHLWRLFRALDVGDRGGVSWDEFTDFMTDAASRGPVQPQSDVVNLYRADRPIERTSAHPLLALRFMKSWDRVCALSQDSFKVNGLMERVVDVYEPGRWERPASRMWFSQNIAAYEYLPIHKALIVSSADLQLRIYDIRNERGPALSELSAGDTYCLMMWSDVWNRLFAAGTTGCISTWQVPDNLKLKNPQKLSSHHPHHSSVTKMMCLPTDGSIVSSSMDPRLIIQEPQRGEIVADLIGHRSAVRDFSYSPEHHFIVSCGFDPEIHLWSLHSFSSSGASGFRPILLHDREEPHRPAIVGVHCVVGTPQLVSIDQTGLLKIWDLRTYKCVQNIVLDPTGLGSVNRDKEFFGLTYIEKHRQFLCYTHRQMRVVHYTDISRDYCAETAEDVLVGMKFSSSSGCLVSCTQSALQTWELRSGVKSGEYATPKLHGEVTAMALDYAGRKVLVGYRGGFVAFFSASNGHFFNKLVCSPADADIVDVACHSFLGVCFAVDSLGSVKGFSDRDDSLELCTVEEGQSAKYVRVSDLHHCLAVFHGNFTVTMYTLRQERGAVPVFSCSFVVAQPAYRAGPSAAFTTNDSIVLRTTRSFAQRYMALQNDGKQEGESEGEVNCACYAGSFPALICGDSTKHLSVWTVPPHPQNGLCLARYLYLKQWDISTVAYSERWSLLYFATAGGSIYCLRASFPSLSTASFANQGVVTIPTLVIDAPETLSPLTPSLMHRSQGDSQRASFQFIASCSMDRAARINSLVLVEELGLILLNTSERVLHAYLMALSSSTVVGYLSLDTAKYTYPEPVAKVMAEIEEMVRSGCLEEDQGNNPLEDCFVESSEREEAKAESTGFFQTATTLQAHPATSIGLDSGDPVAIRRKSPRSNHSSSSHAGEETPVSLRWDVNAQPDASPSTCEFVPARHEQRKKTPMRQTRSSLKQRVVDISVADSSDIQKRLDTLKEQSETLGKVDDMYCKSRQKPVLSRRERAEQNRKRSEFFWGQYYGKQKDVDVPRGSSDFQMPVLTNEMRQSASQLLEKKKADAIKRRQLDDKSGMPLLLSPSECDSLLPTSTANERPTEDTDSKIVAMSDTKGLVQRTIAGHVVDRLRASREAIRTLLPVFEPPEEEVQAFRTLSLRGESRSWETRLPPSRAETRRSTSTAPPQSSSSVLPTLLPHSIGRALTPCGQRHVDEGASGRFRCPHPGIFFVEPLKKDPNKRKKR